jgi:hypothetical protein
LNRESEPSRNDAVQKQTFISICRCEGIAAVVCGVPYIMMQGMKRKIKLW